MEVHASFPLNYVVVGPPTIRHYVSARKVTLSDQRLQCRCNSVSYHCHTTLPYAHFPARWPQTPTYFSLIVHRGRSCRRCRQQLGRLCCRNHRVEWAQTSLGKFAQSTDVFREIGRCHSPLCMGISDAQLKRNNISFPRAILLLEKELLLTPSLRRHCRHFQQ